MFMSMMSIQRSKNCKSPTDLPKREELRQRSLHIGQDTCLEVSSMTAYKTFVTSSGKRPASAWDWAYWSVAVNRDGRVDRERNYSGTVGDLEVKSWSQETILALRSTREAMEATSPTTAT